MPSGRRQRGVELDQRLEREAALGEARMRHREARLVDDLVAGEQDVEIARARAVAHGAHAPELPLDAQQAVEQLAQRAAAVSTRAAAFTNGG